GQYATNRLPYQFIPDNIKRYVYKQEPGGERVISVNRYEFLLYRLLRDRLEAGDIFCRESIRFRSLGVFARPLEKVYFRILHLIQNGRFKIRESARFNLSGI